MEEESETASTSKTKKIEINFSLCIVCQKHTKEPQCSKPKVDSLAKLLRFISDYADLRDPNITPLHQRFHSISIESLIDNEAFYHQNCYSKCPESKKSFREVTKSNIT